MRSHVTRLVAAFCLVSLLHTPIGLASKNKDKKNAAQAPEFSDSDKKKLADIEQRPEIKGEIQRRWVEEQRGDQIYLYIINSSEPMNNNSAFEQAAFIQKYAQLYPNPMLQRYLNAIGQRLVPRGSPNTYAFKLVLDPLPSAEAYSTGTVLVSTGLVSMLDNEAQLAYVLGHEIAHVEQKHRYEIIRNEVLDGALNQEKDAEAARKRAMITALVTAAGAVIGAAANGANGAALGALAGLGGGYLAARIAVRDRTTYTEWADVYENEADDKSLHYMLDQNYDARESTKLYARLQGIAHRDYRLGLGFFADESRMRARDAQLNTHLVGDLKDTINAKLKAAGLTGSTGDFSTIMEALKHDNGIAAIQYDLF